ncbi:VOC family protein [Kitasatospora sp. LaBMicrA B282]|uniref:VOC family protein n=1 Tax=Kitasatospora sp. LaBMicrA B282 TaxID=3420949 RepID=UPI003D0A9510
MPALASFARIHVDDLDRALPTFVDLTGEQPASRFAFRDLEVARIGGYLLVAGTAEALAPVRDTQATTVVTSLAEVLDLTARHGGQVLDGPNEVPTGRNLTVRHPGGAVIEYVEFDAATRARFAAGA